MDREERTIHSVEQVIAVQGVAANVNMASKEIIGCQVSITGAERYAYRSGGNPARRDDSSDRFRHPFLVKVPRVVHEKWPQVPR